MGEQLGLFDSLAWGNGVLDTLSFGTQETDLSLGRVPDGTGPFSLQTVPTPAASDILLDFNESGHVDFTDFVLFAQAFGKRLDDVDFDKRFDLDRNGEIGFSDFLIFVEGFVTLRS